MKNYDQPPGLKPVPVSTHAIESNPFDKNAIASHCGAINEIVKLHDAEGKLIIASYGQDPATGQNLIPIVEHFVIGDVNEMANRIIEISAEPHRNVYMPLTVMRTDLKSGKRGGIDDIVAVLGLVADFDDDEANRHLERCPLSPTFTLETSEGRYQSFFLFNSPISPQEAKHFAISLKEFTRCDHGTADISHVWRIPGTLNWPNKKKITQGRPQKPQLVRQTADTGAQITTEQLWEKLQAEHTPTQDAPMTEEGPTAAWDGRLDSLPLRQAIKELINAGAAPGERSEALARVISSLILDCNLSDEDIVKIILYKPIGKKAWEKHDPEAWLREDISRVRQHVEERRSPEFIVAQMNRLHAASQLSTDTWTEMLIQSRLGPIDEEAVISHLVNIGIGTKRPLKNELKARREQHELNARQQDNDGRLNRGAGSRTLIEWKQSDLNQMVRETESAIRADTFASTVLLHGGIVSHVVTQAPPFAHGIDDNNAAPPAVPHIVPYGRESLTLRIDQSTMFWKPARQNRQIPLQVPPVLPPLILNNPDSTFPVVQGLIPHPIVLQDGRLLYQEGYDARSHLYSAYGGATFGPQENITNNKFIKGFAISSLMDLFQEFEFDTTLDQYVAVAFLLTVIIRKSLGIAPAILVTANLQGSGKTTLVRIVYILVTGHDLPVMTLSDSHEEVRKALTSALMSSPTMICFDNVPDGLEIANPTVARLLTSTTIKDRLLGVNKEVSLPTNTTVVFTGNNISVDADSARRFICIRLLPKEINPEQRHFKNPDVMANALRLRPEIMSLALGLIHAFIKACGNKDAAALRLFKNMRPSGFPEWDRMVRFPILWASGVDVLEAIDRAKEESTEVLARRGAIDALDEMFPNGKSFTASDVTSNLTDFQPLTNIDDHIIALRGYLIEMNARALMSSKSLGRVLKKLTDYPTKEGLILRKKIDNNQLKYWVEKISHELEE